MEVADHQAQHGGGNWKEGRKWPGEWNRLVMEKLKEKELQLGHRLTAREIMKDVELLMSLRDIPLRFVPYRGQ
jgi:hypothetical protein